MPSSWQHCNNCPFNKNGKKNKSKNHNYIYKQTHISPLSLMPSSTKKATILLVFEAPGIDEWKKCKPICSKRKNSAAAKFNSAMHLANKSINNYDVTEAICCFPGTSTVTKSKARKIQSEIDIASIYCLKNLFEDVKRGQYNKIVCFGNVAFRSVSVILKVLSSYNSANLPMVVHLKHPSISNTLLQDIINNL